MSKTVQALLGIVGFLVVILVLVPMLPTIYFIREVVLIGVIIAAIIWVFNFSGINLP